MGRRSRQFAQGCECLHLAQLALEILRVLLLVSDRIAAMVAVCGERLRMHVQLKNAQKCFTRDEVVTNDLSSKTLHLLQIGLGFPHRLPTQRLSRLGWAI